MLSRIDIAVIAYDEPNHLHICLDGLSRVKHINNHKVVVSIDNSGDDNLINSNIEVANYFSREYIVREKRYDNLLNFTQSIADRFADGADEVILIGDGLLCRTDMLEYIYSAIRDSFILNLCDICPNPETVFCPIVNMISKENFYPLKEWVDQKKYVGIPRPSFESRILTEDSTGHDAIYYAYMVQNDLKTRFADKSYAFHYGLEGRNNPVLSEAELAVNRLIYTENKSDWLDNLIRVISNTDIIHEIERFVPKDFVYA